MRTSKISALLLVAACTYDASVRPGQVITCDDGVCPTGQRCNPSSLTCVSDDSSDPAVMGETVTLAPVPDVMGVPARLGLSGAATIRFSTTEPVATPGLVTTPPLDCNLTGSTVLSFTFVCVPGATTPAFTGPVTVSAHLTDLFGRVADPKLAIDLQLDTEPPAKIDVETDSRVVYRRNPWGSNLTAGAPRFEVSGEAQAAEGGTLVLALNAAGGLEAQGLAAVDGSFGPITLETDMAVPYLVAVDSAGNRSLKTQVHDVAWVATTFGRSLVGQNLEQKNPNRLEAYPVHGRGLVRRDSRYAEVLGSELDDQTLARSAGGWTWEAPVATVPDAGQQPVAAAYDLGRGCVVGFGRLHQADRAFTNEMREAGGKLRHPVDPADTHSDGNPPARWGAALAYDEERGQTVLFGGMSGLPDSVAPPTSETWLYDGVEWNLVNDPPPAGLTPRYGHALAYDARRGRTVLYGGIDVMGNLLHDTWEWDGTRWTRAMNASNAPRGGPMTYDRKRGLVMQLDTTGRLWSWGGNDWVAGAMLPSTATTPRALASDNVRGCLVALTSGAADAGTFITGRADTWELCASGWVDKQVQVGFNPDLLFDPEVGAVTLNQASNAEPLKWTGSVWQPMPVVNAQAPTGRGGVAMAWSQAHQAVVAFGGDGDLGATDETWLWDGGWRPMNLQNPLTPAARAGATLAFDTQMDQLVLAGGLGAGDTWRLDARPNLWLRDAGIAPSPVVGLAPITNGMLAISGLGASSQLSVKTNGVWTQPAVVNPAVDAGALRLAAMPDGGAVALITATTPGQRTVTFFFDGTGASKALDVSEVPQYSQLPALVYEESRGRVLAFGGEKLGEPGPLHDVWELRGQSWFFALMSDPEGDGEPELAPGLSAAHHKGAQRTLVLDPSPTGGTRWLLRSADTRPSLVFHAATGQIGIPANATLKNVHAEVIAGARSELGTGAQLQLWLDGAWVDLGQANTAAPDAPAALQFNESDPVQLLSLLSHQPELGVAIVPRSKTGPSDSEVTVDYAELTVRYRLP